MVAVQHGDPQRKPGPEHELHNEDFAPRPTPATAGGLWDTAIAIIMLVLLVIAGTGVAIWLQ